MELEFDKEIDAILRKGRDGRGVLVGDSPPEPKKHLDADTIAAFAEGALPERAKLLYVEHFADCDPCRRQLSEVIVMNRGADAAAASPASAPIEAIAAPWYAKLFRTPNLAIVMGSLVLVFSGVLGFMLLQRQSQNAANNTAISQATEPDAGHGPYYSDSEAANANTAAAPALNPANVASANAAPNTVGSTSNTAMNTAAPDASGRITAGEEKTAADDRAGKLDDISTKPAPPPAAGALAPAQPVDEPKAARDEDRLSMAETEAGNDKKEKARARKDSAEMDREAMPRSLSKVGPSRAGPLNNTQQQMNNSTFDMSVTRRVGGKTFANRNGAWYDTAYSGQSPTMVRRGSDGFKKLDGGLKSIANELYGTVVIVWKGKAYRIN